MELDAWTELESTKKTFTVVWHLLGLSSRTLCSKYITLEAGLATSHHKVALAPTGDHTGLQKPHSIGTRTGTRVETWCSFVLCEAPGWHSSIPLGLANMPYCPTWCDTRLKRGVQRCRILRLYTLRWSQESWQHTVLLCYFHSRRKSDELEDANDPCTSDYGHRFELPWSLVQDLRPRISCDYAYCISASSYRKVSNDLPYEQPPTARPAHSDLVAALPVRWAYDPTRYRTSHFHARARTLA